MAARSDTGGMQKEFEYYHIDWEIKNYFLATFGKEWYLSGPKILVRNPKTEWKMSLKSENTVNGIQLKLERLDLGTHIVRVNWRVTLRNKDGEEYFYEDLETRNVSTKFRCTETYLKCFEENFKPFQDTLIIKCKLIVSREDDTCVPVESTIKNLRSLNENREYDIVIKIKSSPTEIDRTIEAHKEVLQSRSLTFEKLFDRGTNQVILEQDSWALIRVILYLYTNDLKWVLSKPTISLFECLCHLEINEALLYYVPDRVNFKTTPDVQNYTIQWVIENVSGRTEDTITSPIWNDSISETCWELQLKLERMDEYMRMSISAESTGNVNPMTIEYIAKNCNDFIITKSNHPFLKEGDVILQIENLFKSELSQISSLLPDNKLYISFKIQTLLSETVSKRESRSRWFLH